MMVCAYCCRGIGGGGMLKLLLDFWGIFLEGRKKYFTIEYWANNGRSWSLVDILSNFLLSFDRGLVIIVPS